MVIADLNGEAARGVAEEIKRSGGSALALTVDVAREDQVNQMVERTIEQFGRIDILVNNTAGPGFRKLFQETSVDDWNLEMDPIFAKGHAKNPMSDAEIEAKFRRLAAPLMKPDRMSNILERLWRLEEFHSVQEIMALFKL